ncbi:MAG: SDR family oxidoreductase [Pseudomonadota bacterium]
MRNECALITGASSGIGAELAREFAAAGFDLVLVARNRSKLRALANALSDEFQVDARVEVRDLSRRNTAAALAHSLRDDNIAVSALVNNAGVLEQGRFINAPPATQQQLIDLNVSGVTAMLGEFLPDMVERRYGRVLNVASIAAFQPVPLLAVYAATKAFVLSLTESLSEELSGTGVTATALCPGVTDTGMVDNVLQKSSGVTLPSFVLGEAEQVAAAGFKACMKGQAICVPGVINRASVLSSQSTPRWLTRRVAGVLGRYFGGDD